MYVVKVDSGGWIRKKSQKNDVPKNYKEVSKGVYEEVESANPSKVEKAWHWNGGNPELRETGSNIPPDPDEARGVILSVAQSELGWDKSKVRSVRNDQRTNLFFDYVTEGNYEGAKTEIDYIVSDTDLITESEGQTFKDALDGKL